MERINVATVLAELSEVIDGEALVAEAHHMHRWRGCSGWASCSVEAGELPDHLDAIVNERGAFPVPLAPWRPMTGAPRDVRWRVAVNADVDPDL